MIIQLSRENWADLLPSVPRRQLVQLLFQLDDRQFAKILQFFLTEVGQITLGELRIVAARENDPNGGGPIVEVRKISLFRHMPPDLVTNLPEGPMPINIKNFKLIELSYFNESVANFLYQFQREQQPAGNSLLDNVNFCFSSSLSPQHQDNTIMHILDQLMPMIGNINSMSICHLDHMEFGSAGLGPNNAASQLLTKARILQIHNDMQMSTFVWCDWLNTPRDDGKPRVLRLISVSFSNTRNLIEQIRKDFSNATLPVSFFVDVRVQEFWGGNVNWQDICLDNGQKERLVVKTSVPTPMGLFQYLSVLISRYPVGANQEWIEANEREIVEWKFLEQNRLIRFD